MRKLECRREALFQYRGLPPVGMAVSMALQHLVAMIVGCVTPAIIIANVAGLAHDQRVPADTGIAGHVRRYHAAAAVPHRWALRRGAAGDLRCQLRLSAQYAGHRLRAAAGWPLCRAL